MMKKYFIISLCCLGVLLLGYSLQGNQKNLEEEKLWTVGTNAEFPPYTYFEDGKIIGFDIDIANEVCKRLGKDIKFVNMPFDALIPEVTMEHVHFLAAGLSSTEERAKKVLFTKPYLLEDPLVILTLKQQFHGEVKLEDLVGKTAVVNEGYTADLFLSSIKGLNLLRLTTPVDGFMALKNGRADAFITPKSTLNSFLSSQDKSLYGWSEIKGTAENCCLVASKKHPGILEKIQSALDAMEDDGTLTKLKTKWKLL